MTTTISIEEGQFLDEFTLTVIEAARASGKKIAIKAVDFKTHKTIFIDIYDNPFQEKCPGVNHGQN